MCRRACALGVVLLWGIGALGALEGQVGTVLSSSGEAAIDAFGKDVFIPVQQGDVLYRDTVLMTGPSGSMVLRLDEAQQEVPPGSTVRVTELLTAGRKRRGLGWFQSVLTVIGKLAGQASEDTVLGVVLGTRAFEVGEEDLGFDWAEEEDPDEAAWNAARERFEESDFSAALASLLQIQRPGVLEGVLPGEVDYRAGTCYFQLGNYEDAELRLDRAYGAVEGSGLDRTVLSYYPNLLFQLGAASYLLGHEARSADRLEALLAVDPPGEIRPYLYLFLVRALQDSDKNREARTRLEEALREFRGTSFESEFRQLGAQ